jgi:DNA (cytosine-5)-methyltransferase 1
MPEFNGGFKDHHPRKPVVKKDERSFSVVSLFSGCGGLDLGFLGGFSYLDSDYEQLPFEILAAYDNSADAVETYHLNIDEHAYNVDLASADLSEIPAADVVIGGFPCQDFSSSGPKVGLNGSRGQLYTVIRDYIALHRPSVFVVENVPHLKRMRGGEYLDQIVSDFEDCDYRTTVWELFCPDYGLSQSRRRIFIIGVRNDLKGFPQVPSPTFASQHRPIEDALEDLEEVTDEAVTNQSQYFVASRATAGGGQGDHTNVAGKLAYCIRANARGRIQFHYNLDRRLTVRECARLQAFPDDFVFPYSTQRNLTLIGNAVPPIVGHAVASSIQHFLTASLSGEFDNEGADETWTSSGTARQLALSL